MLKRFETHRPLLFGIAYRMLGSVSDAEDIVQDAYLRYQATNEEKIESHRAFLTTIVTRLCLNRLNSAAVQRETYLGPWLPEPLLTADRPDLGDPATSISDYEAISMAFLALLEQLTPAERAVFLLREVFDYEYSEIAQILDNSAAACRQLFSRAKKHLTKNRRRFRSTREDHQKMLSGFMEAIDLGELDGLINLLADDVVFWADGGGKVRGAATQPVYGAQAVAAFLLNVSRQFAPAGYWYEELEVNGRPGLVLRTQEGKAFTVITLEVSEGRIHEMRGISNPDKLMHL